MSSDAGRSLARSLLRLAPLFLALLGCRAHHETRHLDPGVPIPAAWSARAADPGEDPALPEAQETPPAAEAWWGSFQSVELDALIEEGLAGNHDLAAAAQRVQAAAAAARIAGADRIPTLSALLSADRRRQNFIGLDFPGAPDPFSTTSTSLFAGLASRWEVDLWGRISSAAAAAGHRLEATVAQQQGARLSLAAQIARAWFALAEARLQVDLARATAESTRQTADDVRDRFERGVRPSLDLRLALSNLADMEEALTAREQHLDGARRRLEVLVGRYPAGALEAAAALPALPPPVPAGIPADLLRRRPDLLAAGARLAAAFDDAGAARAALLPRLSLTTDGGRRSEELADLLRGGFTVWSLAAGLTAPLFEGGRLRAAARQARARAREARAFYRRSLLEAFREVEIALVAEELLGRRHGELERGVAEARAARRLAEARYGSGLVDFLTVLTAEVRAAAAESRLIALERRRLDARVDLIVALGGAFRPPPARQPSPRAAAGREGDPPQAAQPPPAPPPPAHVDPHERSRS